MLFENCTRHVRKKPCPFLWWHGFLSFYDNLLGVTVDRLFIFIVFVYEKAIDKGKCVYNQYPNEHGKWSII
jgi:hypothetical protein